MNTNSVCFSHNADEMAAMAALIAGLNRFGVPYTLRAGVACTFVHISTGY